LNACLRASFFFVTGLPTPFPTPAKSFYNVFIINITIETDRGKRMIIMVNGKQEEISGATSLVDFLDAKGIPADGVVIELNQDILEKSVLKDIQLKENDQLEILRFVGGG
jgi:sulfur carrier protein